MKQIGQLRDRLRGLTDAIARYPLTAAFLLAAVVVNAFDISTEEDHLKLLLTFVVGAFLSAVLQVSYERYFYRFSTRVLLMGAAVLLTYYLIIIPAPSLGMEIGIRTSVALFALLIAFIWVPVIKSRITFNESFMAAFKSLFNSLFFAGIIFGGVSIIIAAINQLLFTVDYKAYSHAANIVFIIFAPMYFLSLIPIYPGAAEDKQDQEIIDLKQEKVKKATSCPKFLEILISYIIIPLIEVFTVILVIYIIQNIGGKFWTDNLLEPMLISYSIAVILVYILASGLNNKFAILFRRIFPKVLVPIVLFQITSSVIKLEETGVTHNRYYVILFGIFAAAGFLLSIIPVKKNGIIGAMLIIFAVISIVPPVDAFTVSRFSQAIMLKNVLLKNNMLENNVIKPNSSIAEKDKKIITNTISYLSRMEYINKITWIPDDFNIYNDFNKTFGFNESGRSVDVNPTVYLSIEKQTPIDITEYDSFVFTNIYIGGNNENTKISDIVKSGKSYTLIKNTMQDQCDVKLVGENNQELISFRIRDIFDKFYDYDVSKSLISIEQATFSKENDLAKIKFVVQNLNIDKASNQTYYGADLYVFVKIK